MASVRGRLPAGGGIGLAGCSCAMIAFDGLSLVVLIVCLAGALCTVWGAFGTPGLSNFLPLVFLFVMLAAVVVGASNLLVWYFAWEFAIFTAWGVGRWAGSGAQTTLGALPLQGVGSLGSLAMVVAALLVAMANAGIAIPGVEDSRPLLAFLLAALLLKSFALLSPAWYSGRDAQSFFVAQAFIAAAALPVVGLYPFLRFLFDNLSASAEWRAPAFAVALAVATVAGFAALGARDLPQAAAYLIFSQFAGLLARFALLEPSDLPLVLAQLIVYALSVVALALCLARVTRLTDERNLRSIGGLAERMPGTAVVFLLSGIGLAGLPPLAGFVVQASTTATHVARGNLGNAYLLFGLGALSLLVVLRLFQQVFASQAARQPLVTRAASSPLLAMASAIVLALLFVGIVPATMEALLNPAMAFGR